MGPSTVYWHLFWHCRLQLHIGWLEPRLIALDRPQNISLANVEKAKRQCHQNCHCCFVCFVCCTAESMNATTKNKPKTDEKINKKPQRRITSKEYQKLQKKKTKNKNTKREKPKRKANLAKIYGQFCTFLMCENHSTPRPKNFQKQRNGDLFFGSLFENNAALFMARLGLDLQLQNPFAAPQEDAFSIFVPGQCSQFCSFKQPQENNQLGWHTPLPFSPPPKKCCMQMHRRQRKTSATTTAAVCVCVGQQVGRCTGHRAFAFKLSGPSG